MGYIDSSRRIPAWPVVLFAALLCATLALSLSNLRHVLPFALWDDAVRRTDPLDVRQILFFYSALPRLAISVLVGAGLALAGVLFQQVLRNPLAEPATLGVSSGAQLGVTLSTLWLAPVVWLGQQTAAMIGALAIGVVVFGVAWGKRMAPMTLILAGLVVSLYCSAANSLLALFHDQQLENLFLWSSGVLNQQDWLPAQALLPRLALAWLLALLLNRPLTLLGVDDDVARNLGLGLVLARLGALLLALALSAQLVGSVGIIGFIGLFAPILARLSGARRLAHRLWAAPIIGALLLCFTDQVLVALARWWREVPTGTATAVVGAPILLWLLPRLHQAVAPPMADNTQPRPERAHLVLWLCGGLLILLVGYLAAMSLGRTAHGWHWAVGQDLRALLPWRWPRTLAALCAGMMLAAAGTLIQKLSANPMGSPEVLGVSAGAASAVVLMLLLVPGDAFAWLLPAGSIGAALTLLVVIAVSGRRHFSTQRMLLAGIALGTAFTTLISLLLISGDPRLGGLLAWISGSTYNVNPAQAVSGAVTAIVLFLLLPFCRRWLEVLPLGTETSRSLGLPVTAARLLILVLASILTAAATLTVGPLSFVGLMAPHMARMLGFRKAMPQLLVAVLIGGLLMMLADWCGRMVLFPSQIPAGLLATFIGAPYFILLLRRQGR